MKTTTMERQQDDSFGRRWPRLDGVDLLRGLAMEIARRSGHIPLGTFDRDLAKLEGTQHVS